MIYRLGFWIGPSPADVDAGCADFHTRMFAAEAVWEEFDRPPPPVPRIRRFVESVLEQMPDDGSEHSPWKYSDVVGDAMADTFMPVIRGPHRPAIAFLTALAHEHGLQALDLASHRLLSAADLVEVDGLPWTNARLGGDLYDLEPRACRGPEIARERLGLPARIPDAEVGDEEYSDR